MVDVTGIRKSLLQNLLCSSCKGLLSVSPIILNASGKSICGRCQSDYNKDLVLHNIFYELIACNFIFPCRFASEGCSVKINFNGVQTHEECCVFRAVKCQIKDCQWNGIIAESKVHYDKHHQELVVQNKSTNEICEGSGYFLLTVDGFSFLIEWIFSEYMFKIKVTNLDICDKDENISFMYTLATVEYQEIEKSCLILNKNVTEASHNISIKNEPVKSKISLSINATIPISVLQKRQENIAKIKCQNCSAQMVPPILKCPRAHIICLDCSDSEYNICHLCDEYPINFSRVPELEYIAHQSQFICKWEDCNEIFSCREIQTHEQICHKRIFNCLHCSEWHGLFDEVAPHHNVCNVETFRSPMLVNTEITFTGTQMVRNICCNLLAYYEVISISVVICDEFIEVYIYYDGRRSLLGWFDYEVCLRHIDDIENPFNKTYNVISLVANRFTVQVPFADTSRFGGSEFFKIIVKVKLLEGEERKINLMKYFQIFC